MAFIRELDPRQGERLKVRLGELKFDPFRARPKADIKNCGKHRGMVFYRLRIGDFRAVYVVEGNDVKVTEIFRRGRGYRWVD
jgi:mRNA interferase RelE/StbE